jgi:hypothetical protein
MDMSPVQQFTQTSSVDDDIQVRKIEIMGHFKYITKYSVNRLFHLQHTTSTEMFYAIITEKTETNQPRLGENANIGTADLFYPYVKYKSRNVALRDVCFIPRNYQSGPYAIQALWRLVLSLNLSRLLRCRI